MKKSLMLLISLALVSTLSGCACRHEWTAADCTHPATCVKCGETVGMALGHSFSEATCTKPKTCTVCGAAEGEALGHAFSEETYWESSVCTVCGEPAAETDEAVRYPAVLMYHCVLDEPFSEYTELFVRPDDFEEQLRALSDAGYTFLFADEFGTVEEKCVIITLDDGYSDNYANMFPLLEKYNAKATIFMPSSFIGRNRYYLNSAQIAEIAQSGYVRFGSHTVRHSDMSLYTDPSLIRTDLETAQSKLAELTGQPVRTLAWPYGAFSEESCTVARDIYDFAFTMKEGHFDGGDNCAVQRFTVPRGMSARELLDMIEGR